MVLRFAGSRSWAVALAALVALATVMFAGAASAHEVTRPSDLSVQWNTMAEDADNCPVAAMECDGNAGGSSMPCSGNSGSACSQSGVYSVPGTIASPDSAICIEHPPVDRHGPGIVAAVDLPPPRA